MTALELLAPARNKDIGIAAIDCGADAVYIAGPDFGARKDAGNPVSDIAELCRYAHKFGARIFVTFNISVTEEELPQMHSQMLAAQEAGADAFIIRDERICLWDDITVPLHASTQCAIRTLDRARHFEALGCERIVLERELPLETVREICSGVSCEVEFFVHGALCVCYSGECRLSESIDGRSADRGECMQACRSLYDLTDAEGRVLVRNKALLSLKDYNLLERLGDLADAGVMSFKIEGRLKNASYVRNVVAAYSSALNHIIASSGGRYCRASFGKVITAFSPDLVKTFNRGYTQLWLDGERYRGWSSMDTPKSMGEAVGTVSSVQNVGPNKMEITLKSGKDVILSNGDGFSFVRGSSIEGFRGDLCEGRKIVCKHLNGLKIGTLLYRNISAAFEKAVERGAERLLDVSLSLVIKDGYDIEIRAVCEDGREVVEKCQIDAEAARNKDRVLSLLSEGLGKKVGHYACRLVSADSSGCGQLPLLSSAFINSLRRGIIEKLDLLPVPGIGAKRNGMPSIEPAIPPEKDFSELMRMKYCIRYELGLCPVHQGAAPTGPLFLLNNGRRFALGFDCSKCEMTVNSVNQNPKI